MSSKPFHPLLSVAAGLVLTVLLLELVLRVLPVTGKGVYGAELDPSWPMHHMIPNSSYTYSAGWNLTNFHQGTINNMGYVAPFDYEAGTSAAIVLGDSYIESLMNNYDATLQGRLARMTEQPVLQFANSGGSMPDYLAVAKLVAQRFQPQWGVILLSEGDFVEGFTPNNGYYSWDETQNPPVKLIGHEEERSVLAKVGRQLALVRYVRYNLRANFKRLIHAEPVLPPGQEKAACEPVNLSASDARLVDAFARQLPGAFGLDPSRIVLIFDADRKTMYGPGPREQRCPTRDSAAQQLLRERARAQGMHIVETDPVFSEYYARTGRKLDYSPVDWHWNGEAHRLVAEEVASIITHGP